MSDYFTERCDHCGGTHRVWVDSDRNGRLFEQKDPCPEKARLALPPGAAKYLRPKEDDVLLRARRKQPVEQQLQIEEIVSRMVRADPTVRPRFIMAEVKKLGIEISAPSLAQTYINPVRKAVVEEAFGGTRAQVPAPPRVEPGCASAGPGDPEPVQEPEPEPGEKRDHPEPDTEPLAPETPEGIHITPEDGGWRVRTDLLMSTELLMQIMVTLGTRPSSVLFSVRSEPGAAG